MMERQEKLRRTLIMGRRAGISAANPGGQEHCNVRRPSRFGSRLCGQVKLKVVSRIVIVEQHVL
jgi:hypothetical protein